MARLGLVRELKYAAIYGLRFDGPLLVFFVHFGTTAGDFIVGERASTEQLFGIGHGFDLFFIISGFLIPRMLARREINYATFATRRLLGIYSAFLVAFIAAVIFRTNQHVFTFDFWSVLGELVNAIKSLDVTPYLGVSWLLGHEFAFYFTAPIAVAILWRSPLVGLTIISIVALALSPMERRGSLELGP